VSGWRCCLLRLVGVSVVGFLTWKIIGLDWHTASDFFNVIKDEVHQLVVAFERAGYC